MTLPANKTKIVCTIGPASDSMAVMEKMLLAGMNVARLNFSHGDFAGHKKVIDDLRVVSRNTGRRITIMADLPGPKMRIGQLREEPIELMSGDDFVLTSEEIYGDAKRVSMSFTRLPKVVKPGDSLYINDGYIQIEVVKVEGNDVHCKVIVGGILRSRKGLNLPGIDLGIQAFTEHDRDCLQFALAQGVDAVSQSFVENAEDIKAVREAAASMGHHPFIIAKIERSGALNHMDEILAAADGIMIARGDLGVEIPIEQMAVAQKQIMRKANMLGKPVITATQMLESMTENRLPTRAEATDVANAILDGTDCVMLSGESAMGKYPVEAVTMLSKIAAAIEPHRPSHYVREALTGFEEKNHIPPTDLIALSVERTLEHISPAAVIVPTHSGASARGITRFRLPVWIVGVSSQENTCQRLQFSYGVCPVHEPDHPDNWNAFAKEWLQAQGLGGEIVVLTEGPSKKHPEANNRMEIIDLT
ncbi:MAG: pyruvate kinase, partial [Deltaproteobacteria bacterium]|nr:pyruvate kinase [Deltaproteobacteria bacterium]